MREHQRIAAFFAPLAAAEGGSFGLTDDAAVLIPPKGKKLVITTDSVIEGIHVPKDATPTQITQKLIRRNLSDLAAMGATPWRYLLNIHTPPTTSDTWFAEFARALAKEQQHFGLTLTGGDTASVKGPIHATMTCLGLLDGKPLLRSGAKPGDVLYVSGTIGDAVLGLRLVQKRLDVPAAHHTFLMRRYYQPEPRLALGQKLQGLASAAIDCSDGLLADAVKLAAGITIERNAVPLSPAARALLHNNKMLWETILSGGDDYELIFTAPRAQAKSIAVLSKKLGLPLTPIGRVTKRRGFILLDAHGKALPTHRMGFEH